MSNKYVTLFAYCIAISRFKLIRVIFVSCVMNILVINPLFYFKNYIIIMLVDLSQAAFCSFKYKCLIKIKHMSNKKCFHKTKIPKI
jgi:hypothetical protein